MLLNNIVLHLYFKTYYTMANRTKYGELTKMVSFRIPESMVERVKDIVYSSIDIMQYEKSKERIDKIVPTVVLKAVKEPKSIKSVPFATKSIKLVGYACFKDDFSDVCYYKDSLTTALVFDNEEHLKEYLIKFKP